MKRLVIHDADAIQKYVFATNRLREIRGASALIDDLNRQESVALLKKYGGTNIYAAGGGLGASFPEENVREAENYCREVRALYRTKAVTTSSTGVVVDYDENAADGFRRGLLQAHLRLRQEKSRINVRTQLATSAYFKRCQACGIYPAICLEHQSGGSGRDPEHLCQSCWAKRSQQSAPRAHRIIEGEALKKFGSSVTFAGELDEIGAKSHPEGYIGLIYADGNRIGDRSKEIGSEEALSHFYEVVDLAVASSVSGVLLNRYGPGSLPLVVPICGGDDLAVIVPANDALPVAIDYLKAFQDWIRHNLKSEVAGMVGGAEVSACAGVAIGKAHTPVSKMFDLAQDLCGLAKRKSFEYHRNGKETPCLDFHVITTPSWTDMVPTRGSEYVLGDNIRLTARPYTVDDAGNVMAAAAKLKEQSFPSSKLHDLYRSLRLGQFQARLYYQMAYLRSVERSGGPRQQTALRDVASLLGVGDPPWRPFGPEARGWFETPYGDLVEIYPFVS